MEVRTNTILLRGVNEMSTDDIFNYFAKYPPASLEWIDDSLCKFHIISELFYLILINLFYFILFPPNF